MSQSVIGALRVNLGLDSARFESGARRVKSPVARLKAQFVAIAGAATIAGTAISAMALKGAQDIDRSAKAARRLGSSVAGFRALELAAGEAGVSLDTLTDGVQTMDREIARGGKKAMGALRLLGVAADDLDGKDADQKLALIADRVADLGLSTGEASVLLQDLGVRNREMVLAVLAGGDAFRDARADVEDYGLALEKTDSDAIEQANDRIGRLGLIGRYAAQQLAVALVPAMGRLAETMTDSLREGGLLRAVIDGLTDNIERLGTYLAVAVAGFGVRFVGALVVAKLATFSFAGALTFLKGALARTGIGLLIVGAGELVYWFSRLVGATGGFGNAMAMLKAVAVEVWGRIQKSAAGMYAIIKGVAKGIGWAFVSAFAWIGEKWDSLINGLRQPFNDLMASIGADVHIAASDIGGRLRGVADEWKAAAISSIKTGGDWMKAAGRPLESLQALRDAVKEVSDETDDGAADADRLADALGGVGDAAAKMRKLKDATQETSQGMSAFKSSAQSAFEGIVTGAKSLKEALGDVLNSLAKVFINSAFQGLWSGLGGGGFFGKILGFANGTRNAPGGLAMVGERGRELVHLPRGAQVSTAQETQRLLGDVTQEIQVVGGDLTLTDGGQIMAAVRVEVSDGMQATRQAVRAEMPAYLTEHKLRYGND